MFVFSHTLVHPRILQGQVVNFKPSTVHLDPVLEVSQRGKSEGETECVFSVHVNLCCTAQICWNVASIFMTVKR